MENQESKSKWDDLARQLGAEIRSDEPPAVPPSSGETPAESYSEGHLTDKLRAPRPKRPAADWSQLNTQLGLPPVEEPPPPPPRPASAEHSQPISGPDPEREERPREARSAGEYPPRTAARGDRPQRERDRGREQRERGHQGHDRREREGMERERGSRGGRDRAARPEETAEREGDERGPRRRRRGGRGRRDRDSERLPQRSRDERDQARHDQRREATRPFISDDELAEMLPPAAQATEFESPRPTPARAEPPAAEPPAPPPAPSPGISLWHKIFGSPAQQAAKLQEEEEIVREESVEIDQRITERESSWEAVESSGQAEPTDEMERGEADTDVDMTVEAVGEVEPAESDESRPRRGRRRRGRGRGGRGGERRDGGERSSSRARQSSHQVSSVGGDDDFDDLGVEQDDESDVRHVASENGDQLDGGATFDESLDSQVAETGGDGRGHRSIPSWEEAIGFIVDANLQSRPHRRQMSHSGSRGGSSRGGRSRGGRRRGRPSNGPAN